MKMNSQQNLKPIDVVDMVLDGFDGADATVNGETVFVTLDNGEDYHELKICIVRPTMSKTSRVFQGVHIVEDAEDTQGLEDLLWRAVETAVRDGFPTIYIHAAEIENAEVQGA